MTASAAHLQALLAPLVAETGSDLEDVSVSKAGKRSVVRVLVDRDGGIDLDDVAEVSRLVSDALDELDAQDPKALGPSYTLEVSSPGVDRPLTAPRHWRRNTGRLVLATLADGTSATGRVAAADEQSLTLDLDGSARTLRYDEVVRGVVQIEFTRRDQEASDQEASDQEDKA